MVWYGTLLCLLTSATSLRSNSLVPPARDFDDDDGLPGPRPGPGPRAGPLPTTAVPDTAPGDETWEESFKLSDAVLNNVYKNEIVFELVHRTDPKKQMILKVEWGLDATWAGKFQGWYEEVVQIYKANTENFPWMKVITGAEVTAFFAKDATQRKLKELGDAAGTTFDPPKVQPETIGVLMQKAKHLFNLEEILVPKKILRVIEECREAPSARKRVVCAYLKQFDPKAKNTPPLDWIKKIQGRFDGTLKNLEKKFQAKLDGVVTQVFGTLPGELENLGRIVACDMFVGNTDRVWSKRVGEIASYNNIFMTLGDPNANGEAQAKLTGLDFFAPGALDLDLDDTTIHPLVAQMKELVKMTEFTRLMVWKALLIEIEGLIPFPPGQVPDKYVKRFDTGFTTVAGQLAQMTANAYAGIKARAAEIA